MPPLTYKQRTGFTCGPVALQAAMAQLDPDRPYDSNEEFTIWREANTIFMHESHPGTGPYGLALAAKKRGFYAEVWQKGLRSFYDHWNQDLDDKQREIVAALDIHDRAEAERAGIPAYREPFTMENLATCLAEGDVPLVMNMQETSGHWIVVLAMDDIGATVFDPDPDEGHSSVQVVPLEHFAQHILCPNSDAMVAVILSHED